MLYIDSRNMEGFSCAWLAMVELSHLCTLETDGLHGAALVEELVLAELVNLLDASLLAREDVLDGTLAGDVLNLAAREVVAHGETMGIGLRESGRAPRALAEHAAPQLRLHLSRGLLKLHLEKESTLKGRVEVAREVRRGDDDGPRLAELDDLARVFIDVLLNVEIQIVVRHCAVKACSVLAKGGRHKFAHKEKI